MTWVAVAIGGSALLGAAASGSAARSAARSAGDAADVQWQMYNQTRSDLAPYREVGTSALNAYARAMGLPGYGEGSGRSTNPQNAYQYPTSGPANEYAVVNAFQEFLGRAPTERERNYYTGRNRADQLYYDVVQPGMQRAQTAAEGQQSSGAEADRYGGFYASPGYQFGMDEGLRALDRNAAARGRYMSGSRDRGAIRYAENYASNEFNNYMNRLAGAAGIGQNATNQGAASGSAYGGNIGNAYMAQGDARASGYMGVANTLNNAANNMAMYGMVNNWRPGNSAVGPYAGGYRFG